MGYIWKCMSIYGDGFSIPHVIVVHLVSLEFESFSHLGHFDNER